MSHSDWEGVSPKIHRIVPIDSCFWSCESWKKTKLTKNIFYKISNIQVKLEPKMMRTISNMSISLCVYFFEFRFRTSTIEHHVIIPTHVRMYGMASISKPGGVNDKFPRRKQINTRKYAKVKPQKLSKLFVVHLSSATSDTYRESLPAVLDWGLQLLWHETSVHRGIKG